MDLTNVEWLFDSGSDMDVICVTELQNFLGCIFQSREPHNVCTVNGMVRAKYQVHVYIAAFDQVIAPYVLQDTPNLLGMGKRATFEQWDIRWAPGCKECRVTIPGKGTFFLNKVGNIPVVADSTSASLCRGSRIRGSELQHVERSDLEVQTEP